MILFDLAELNEDNPVYQALALSNAERHYSFLQSIVEISIAAKRPVLSQTLIKALNYHAIACLHTKAGEYRPCEIGVGDYLAPSHFRVSDLMDDFVNVTNRWWNEIHAIDLAAYVLWRLNYIHPFVNGNGRTARAACYFVLCVKTGSWLGGQTILPQLIRQNRTEYIAALKEADKTVGTGKPINLDPLKSLILRLLSETLNEIGT